MAAAGIFRVELQLNKARREKRLPSDLSWMGYSMSMGMSCDYVCAI